MGLPRLRSSVSFPGAGEGGVPGDSLGVRAEPRRHAVLDDLRARREEVGRGVVVTRVERLAPRADDALRRGLPAAATRKQSQEKGGGEPGTHDPPTIVPGS